MPLSVNGRIGVHHARRARKALGLGLETPVPDLLEAVERIGAPVAVLPLADGVAGAWIAGSIFLNGDQHVVRQRFTLAHELAHVRLDHAPVVDGQGAFSVPERGAPDEEVQANHFAAEFLVPRDAVLARALEQVTLEDVVRLACEFGVSAPMMRIRLETLRVLRDRAHIERLDREIEEGMHSQLAAMLGCQLPADSLSAIDLPRLPARPSPLASYLAGRIGLHQLAAYSGCAPAEMQATLARLGLLSS